MSKYLTRISQDEKSKNKEANILAEANAKAQVEQEISKLKAKKATLTAAHNSALAAVPFNVNRVFELIAEQEATNTTLALAEELLKTEFAD